MAFNSYADVQAALNAESANWNNTQGHQNAAVREHALAAREWWNNYQNPAPQHHHAPAPAASPPRAAVVVVEKGQNKTNAGVKIPDVVVSTYDYSQATIEELEKLYFQNVGGTEILTVARHDNVNGQEVPLSYLDNLKELNTEFNPLNILTTENIYNHFNRFAIDMTQRIDSVNQAVAVDEEASNIVITLDEIQADEYVQIQVANVANDTEFGDGIVWRKYYGEIK